MEGNSYMMQSLNALPVGVWHIERSKDSGRAFSNVQREHRELRLSGSLSAPEVATSTADALLIGSLKSDER
jgi:hypothetical protein